MKKTMAILVALLLLLGTLAGCAGSSDAGDSGAADTGTDGTAADADAGTTQEDTTEEAGQEKEDITLVMSRWAGPHADDQKTVIAEYPDATVEMNDIDYGNLKQKQIQSLSSTGEFDLVWASEIWLPEYVSKGWVLPLDDYVQASGLDMSMYSEGMVQANTYDGHLYALPTFAQTLILTYNSEWFEREGQKVPTTVEELLQVAKYFKEQGTGIALPAAQGQPAIDMFAQFLYSAGGDYFDEEGNFDLTSEAAVYAANLYDELCSYAMDGSFTWAHDQVSEAIRTGKAPFGITVTGLASMDTDPEQSVIVDSVGYAPIPGRDSVVGCVSYWSWTIAANSENPQAAFDLIQWLCSPEVEKEQALMNGQISAVSALADDPEVVENMPFLPAANETLANAKTQPTSESASVIFEPIGAALSEIATTDTPVEEILAGLQETLKDVKQ